MSSSRSKAVRAVASAVAAGLCVAAVSGCGDDVPAGAVAKVGDTVIAKKDFDSVYVTSASSAEQQVGTVPALTDAPNFTACVAAKKQQQAPGQQPPPDSDLRKGCKQIYEQVRQQVMGFLIQSQWVLQEAEEQDVEVSDAEIVETFEQQKQESFPKEKDYRRFLRESGSSESQILFRVKIQTIQQKLTQKIQKEEKDAVGEDDIEEYYEKNKKRLARPEQRDLRIVLTQTKAKADQARRQLEDGASFKSVAKRLSIDPTSKARGGRMPDVTKGKQEPSIDQAVFGAERGELEGPVKTASGWLVFEVEKITPSKERDLEAVKDTIRTQLGEQGGQKALEEFIEEFREDYTDKTVCADDYLVPECSNGPQSKTDTGPASGGEPGARPAPPTAPGAPGAPQGAPPPGAQGAPQQGAPPQPPPQTQPPQAPPPTAP